MGGQWILDLTSILFIKSESKYRCFASFIILEFYLKKISIDQILEPSVATGNQTKALRTFFVQRFLLLFKRDAWKQIFGENIGLL